MKKLTLCLTALNLMTSSLSWALKVTNLSNKTYEVTFIKNEQTSPLCLLRQHDHITDLEALGKDDDRALISVKLKAQGSESAPLIWEKLPPEIELLIPAEPLLMGDGEVQTKASFSQYLGNIASFIVYYGGILVSIPAGALVSMEPAAQLGGVLGPALIPQLALKLGGYTFFNPLNYFSTALVGVISGYAIGAVGGAIVLPLTFSMVYKSGAWLVNYCIQEVKSPQIEASGNLENSWIYLPAPPANNLSFEDDWVIVDEQK